MDVVIMSCVRASEPGLQTGIGFVSDIRRMNVAITRAKRALWILGSAATLKVGITLPVGNPFRTQPMLHCSGSLFIMLLYVADIFLDRQICVNKSYNKPYKAIFCINLQAAGTGGSCYEC